MTLNLTRSNNKRIANNRISKEIFTAILSCLLSVIVLSTSVKSSAKSTAIGPVSGDAAKFRLYDSLNLKNIGLSKDAFNVAIKGFDSLRFKGLLQNEKILSIVDFSLPSSKKRLFIIDVVTGKLLYNTYVSHGRNSGDQFATMFSNQINSFQSSLGFYITGAPYMGHNGYSLRLQGMEVGINDNAFNRGIVIHAASYVYGGGSVGHVGRSEGCPAIPVNVHREIIGLIKNGTCLFIYSTDKTYLSQSKYLRNPRVA